MTDNGGVSSVGFTTDSFSPLGIRKIAKVAPSNADPNKNIATIAKECNATLLVGDKPYVEGTAISRDAVISLSMTYSYKDEDGKRPTKDDPNGWYYTFENFDASKLDLKDGDKALEGGITVSGGDGGTYVFVPSENRVYFNYKPDYIANRQNLKGNFSMDYKLNKKETAEEKEITINLGKHTYKIPLKDTDVTGKKDYVVDENGNMIFTISLTAKDADAKNVVVTDKLTGDLTFKEGSFNVQLKGSATKIPLKPTITTTEDGQTAVIALPDDFKIPYGQTAEITYIVTPKTGSQATGGSNEASWSWGSTDSGNSGKTDVDVKFDKDRLSKTAESAGPNRFKYTIDVNKLNETLAPDSSTGTLTLTDVIRLSESENNQGNAYISLVEGSVKVFDKNGKDLISQKKASYSYNQGTNTLKFTVPDGQALKIEYVISVSGVVNDTVSLDNTVNLEGKNIERTWTKEDYKIIKTNAELSGDNGTVKIIKKEESVGTLLKGAKFSVYEVNTNAFHDFDPAQATPVSSGTTDGNGELILGSTDNTSAQFLKPDQLYCLVEDEAPEGYLVSKAGKYHFFVMNASKAHQKEWGSVAENAKKTLINIPEGGTLTLTNVEKPGKTSVAFNASKRINETDVPGTEKFSFSAILSDYVTGGQYYPGTSEYEGISESLADYKKRIINQEKTAENSGATISFKEFELEYEGTYTFKVSEKAGTGNYVYDDSVYTATVEVKRNNITGDLEVTKKVIKKGNSEVSNIVFDNTRTTSFSLTKKVSAPVDAGTDFTFKIAWKDKNGKGLKELDRIQVTGATVSKKNANGATVKVSLATGEKEKKITFTGIPVGAQITITENGKSGWSQVKPPKDGKYLLTISENASENAVTITNSYSASGSWTPDVTKKLVAGGRTLKDKEFNFVVKDQAGTVMTGTNDKNGKVTFVTADEEKSNSIPYTEPGTFTYTIEEVKPATEEKECLIRMSNIR